jgi:hypothetical protein
VVRAAPLGAQDRRRAVGGAQAGALLEVVAGEGAARTRGGGCDPQGEADAKKDAGSVSFHGSNEGSLSGYRRRPAASDDASKPDARRQRRAEGFRKNRYGVWSFS